MTCQECEIQLGMGENAADHLASCEECRALAAELRLNSVVLRGMRVRPRMQWEWGLAVAAALVMGVGLWINLTKKPPELAAAVNIAGPAKQEAPARPAARAQRVKRVRHKQPVQPLKVKMFTSDPDVVIYWIIDTKEGIE